MFIKNTFCYRHQTITIQPISLGHWSNLAIVSCFGLQFQYPHTCAKMYHQQITAALESFHLDMKELCVFKI